MKWLEIAVQIRPDEVEMVSHIFNEMGTGGVVIEDPALIYEHTGAGTAETVAPGLTVPETATVKAYLALDEHTIVKLDRIRPALEGAGLSILDLKTREVAEEDWANSWKKFYKPVRVGKRLVVKPGWENYIPLESDIVIEMDPGMAFGCGTHPSTVMCMRMLENNIQGGETVFDVGTGSGILAVTAAKLGARRVMAVDLDEVAVRVARENVGRNGVEKSVEVYGGNLLDMVTGRADVVVANIIADVILQLAPDAYKILVPEGIMIVSGIIEFRQREVRQALYRTGFFVQEVQRQGEWVAILAVKEGN